jgi:hypothetical protein
MMIFQPKWVFKLIHSIFCSNRLKTLAACLAAKGTMNPSGPPNGVVQGNLCDHPIEFLSDEKLMYVTGAAAAAVGSDVFV